MYQVAFSNTDPSWALSLETRKKKIIPENEWRRGGDTGAVINPLLPCALGKLHLPAVMYLL